MKEEYVYKVQLKRYSVYRDGEIVMYKGKYVYCSEVIGYFSSLKKAKEIIEEYKNIEGFRDYPENFEIKRLKIDDEDFELEDDDIGEVYI